MTIPNLIIIALDVLSFCYAIPYANWEYKQKNVASTIIIYIIALATAVTTISHFFY